MCLTFNNYKKYSCQEWKKNDVSNVTKSYIEVGSNMGYFNFSIGKILINNYIQAINSYINYTRIPISLSYTSRTNGVLTLGIGYVLDLQEAIKQYPLMAQQFQMGIFRFWGANNDRQINYRLYYKGN